MKWTYGTAVIGLLRFLLAAAALVGIALLARYSHAQGTPAAAPSPATAASAPSSPAPKPAAPQRLPTASGEVWLPTALDARAHDEYAYSAVRRAGHLVFLSGVVAGPMPGSEPTLAAYEDGVRRAFRHLERGLKAAGLGFDDVVMTNTFHVWQSPRLRGTKAEQFQAFLKVKNEFMKAPHTAWTAVGVTELLPDDGVVEIQMIAALPAPAGGTATP